MNIFSLLLCISCILSPFLGIGQNNIVAFVRTDPLNEAYFEKIDDWGWKQYYSQGWDSTEMVYQVVVDRTQSIRLQDSTTHLINLLGRIRLGAAKTKKGMFYEGISQIEAALREGEAALGPIIHWSFYHVLVGLLYEEAGNLNKTYWSFEQASRIIAGCLTPSDENYFLYGNKKLNIANIKARHKNYLEAKIYYERAISAYHQAGEPGQLRMGWAYVEYGVVLDRLGLHQRSDSIFQDLAEMPARFKTDWYIQYGKARVEILRGNHDAALRLYREATSYGLSYIQPAHDWPLYRAIIFGEIRLAFADYLLTRGRTVEALKVLDEIDTIAMATGQTEADFFFAGRVKRAQALYAAGKDDEVVTVTQELIRLITKDSTYRLLDLPDVRGNNSVYLVGAFNFQAASLHRHYLRKEDGIGKEIILANCAAGRQIINQILLSHTAEFQYSELLDGNGYLFDVPLSIAFDDYHKTDDENTRRELFQAIERTKNLDISNSLRLRYEARDASDELKARINEERMLMAQQRALEQKMSGVPDDSLQDLRLDLLKTNDRIALLQQELKLVDPDYFTLKNRTKQSCTLKEFQDALGNSEMALLYHVDAEKVTVLAITRSGFKAQRLSMRDLKRNTDLFLSTIKNPKALKYPRRAWQQAANALYEDLVGQHIMDSGIDQLVIIPDGFLNYVPWAALLTGLNENETDWNEQAYLISKYSVTTEASATSLFLQRQKRYSVGRDLYLGMAPLYSNVDEYLGNTMRGHVLATSVPEYFRQLGTPLKYNIEEVEAVSDQFKDDQVFLNTDATESRFKHWAPRASHIHLAAHGLANTERTGYSNIALAAEPGSGEDGLIYAEEIYNLPLNADLVVLSACSTGDGIFRKGAGVQNLARAFRAAGCRNVLSGLWPIEDETAYGLISHFFQELSASGESAEALRLAMVDHLDTEKNPVRTHPYYWTGFSLAGPGDKRFTNQEVLPTRWVLVGGWLIGAVIVALLWRMKSLVRSQFIQ